jgi:hypothetical protein
MQFDVSGPYDLTRHGQKCLITDQSLKDLLFELKQEGDGLDEAVGCYVFALRAGKGYTPWYVGQACRQSLVREALNTSNREKYNKVIGELKGTPTIFLIPMYTPNGKLRKPSKAAGGLNTLDFLERWLIATCIDKNPELVNNKQTKFLRNIHVVGVFSAEQGESHLSSQELCRAIGR